MDNSLDEETKRILLYVLGSVGLVVLIIVATIVAVRCCKKGKGWEKKLKLPAPELTKKD